MSRLICAFCGKEFEGHNVQMYCSKICKDRAWRTRHKEHSDTAECRHQCPICGKSFVAKGNDIYCSVECRVLARSERQRERYIANKEQPKLPPERPAGLKCAFCGKEITAPKVHYKDKNDVWCSRECELATYRKRFFDLKSAGVIKDKTEISVRICEWCGTTFDTPSNSNARFCSPSCRKKAQYAKRKAEKA